MRRAVAAGLPYVYLGYWVEQSPRMQYKVRFQPLERLGPGGWTRMTPPVAVAAPRVARPMPAKDVLPIAG
jgi:arginine-tRNA-protein transferase